MKLLIALIALFPMLAIAAATPTPTPVAVAIVSAPSSMSFLSPGMVALILSIVACMNIVLTAIQQVFAKLAKQEPSWLTTVSKVVLKASQFLGSNPTL